MQVLDLLLTFDNLLSLLIPAEMLIHLPNGAGFPKGSTFIGTVVEERIQVSGANLLHVSHTPKPDSS